MIRKLIVSNYKSLGENVTLELGERITALVGPNGSGKSNLADVFRFVGDCLVNGLQDALKERQGFRRLRRRSAGQLLDVSIRVEVEDESGEGFWEFTLGDGDKGACRIIREAASWTERDNSFQYFEKTLDSLQTSFPSPLRDFIHSFSKENDFVLYYLDKVNETLFSELYKAILGTAIYTIHPDTLREPELIEDFPRRVMEENGAGWASVLKMLDRQTQGEEFLSGLAQITGDIDDYKVSEVEDYLVPKFHHRTDKGSGYWLYASQESDGTLRAVGILLALLQQQSFLSLIGIEEPEQTLHPGAIPVLYDFIRAASYEKQILLTTHSPQLLDLLQIDEVRVVERSPQGTIVARVDESQRELIQKKLFSASYLWQAEGLRPEGEWGDG